MRAEAVTILLFLAGLAACLLLGLNILLALLFGLFCLVGYCLRRGHRPGEVLRMLAEGMLQVKGILIIFVLIGCLTALWRLSGVIPTIICLSLRVVDPTILVACSFLLCSMMSFLTGTSFGTASTMGVLCMMIATSAGVDPMLAGGAVISGIFVGDRCSPMSSSAQLVCTLTHTSIYGNIRNMLRSGAVPFLLTLLLYVLLGRSEGSAVDSGITAVMESGSILSPLCVLPAALILVLALFRVNVKLSMLVSILVSMVLAVAVQGVSVTEVLLTMVRGYRAADPALAALMDGGGLRSMVSVGGIVLLSSSYAGVFSHTPLLDGVRGKLAALASRAGGYAAVLVTSVFTAAVCCNQTLGTMLTVQLCEGLIEGKERFALAIEDTIILIAALIPWSIAGAVPVAAIGAPQTCLLCAFYLFAQPLWGLITSFIRRRGT